MQREMGPICCRCLIQKVDTHAFSRKNKKLLNILDELELDRFETVIKRRSGFDVAMESNSTVLDMNNDAKAVYDKSLWTGDRTMDGRERTLTSKKNLKLFSLQWQHQPKTIRRARRMILI